LASIVIDAMNTKWNALGFHPGLVGGHCIGIDPYYFIYKAKMLGYHSQIIAAGRKINNSMGSFVADAVIKSLIQADLNVRHANIYVFGITFKEDCPDIRNSRAFDVLKRLAEYGIQTKVVDPVADKKEAKHEFGIDLVGMEEVQEADCLIFLVAHKQFKDLQMAEIDALYNQKLDNNQRVVIDVKSIFEANAFKRKDYIYWNL